MWTHGETIRRYCHRIDTYNIDVYEYDIYVNPTCTIVKYGIAMYRNYKFISVSWTDTEGLDALRAAPIFWYSRFTYD